MLSQVFYVRYGKNEELRYSLRSLAANVPHDDVWIFGGWPDWVNQFSVRTVGIPAEGSQSMVTARNIRAACSNPGVSDPFVLWMDDIYAVQPVTEIPRLHAGPLTATVRRYASVRSAWATGLRATARYLADKLPGQELLNYELHVPLIVRKEPMFEALAVLGEIPVPFPHKRTIYGNFAALGGEQTTDVKVVNPRVLPGGAWWSSSDSHFLRTVYPHLREWFPNPSPYELDSA